MKSNHRGPFKKMEEDKDDATATFPNAEKESAAEINNAGDGKSRNYMDGDDDINGPDFDKYSKEADGDTTVNAGFHK